MHHLAVMGKHGGLHQLVFHVYGEHLLLLVDHGLKEGVKVFGVKQRSGCGDTTGHVEMADDLHAIGRCNNLTCLRAFHIATTLHRQIDDDGARLHGLDHVRTDKRGAGRPGMSAVVTTMSCLAMCSATSSAWAFFSSSVSSRA